MIFSRFCEAYFNCNKEINKQFYFEIFSIKGACDIHIEWKKESIFLRTIFTLLDILLIISTREKYSLFSWKKSVSNKYSLNHFPNFTKYKLIFSFSFFFQSKSVVFNLFSNTHSLNCLLHFVGFHRLHNSIKTVPLQRYFQSGLDAIQFNEITLCTLH